MNTNEELNLLAPNLSKSFPRSPRETLAGYVVAARALDKCRAVLAETNGAYHFDCPLDGTFFEFTGIDSGAFKDFIATGATDPEVADWITAHSKIKNETERILWNNKMRYTRPCDMPPELQVYMHKVHHSRWQPETDSNYSSLLSIWDRLFRSFRINEKPETIQLGLDEFDHPADQTIPGLLRTPLTKRKP